MEGVKSMDAIDERFAVYTAIIFICSAIATLTGVVAATATFIIMVLGVELAYWCGVVIDDYSRNSALR